MEQRLCGNSDISLSILGTGCWAYGGGEYWGQQVQRDVDEVVSRAVELGINYFDTAEAYNQGKSEESLGQAIKGLPREKLIIGSKVSPSNCYHDRLIAHCHASLKRLDTDYVDIYMIHWPIHPNSIQHFTNNTEIIENPPTINEAMDAMETLKDQGKIRHIGVSNFASNRLDKLTHTNNIVVNELPYSLLTRAIEWNILPYCHQKGIGVIGYMTLLQGLLADIFNNLQDVPAWQRRTRHFHHAGCELCRHGEEGAEEETYQALAEIRLIARSCGITMPEIAVKWAVANEAITCALVGARNIKKLETNVNFLLGFSNTS